MNSKLNLIILDSNFILLPFQFKIDYLSEIRLNLEGIIKFIIFKQILNELEAKKNREPRATKFQREYRLGLAYLEENKNQFNITFLEEIKTTEETTDDFLLRKAVGLRSENQLIFIATNDSMLRKKAIEFGINTIFLRQNKYLSFKRA
ncbi:MAG: PIN domain-containing protein [Promethearchaeota archaeon]